MAFYSNTVRVYTDSHEAFFHKYLNFVSTFHCIKKYPAINIDTESRTNFDSFTKRYLNGVQLYTWSFPITLKKKSLLKLHDKLLWLTHSMELLGGGENFKVHSPLSWQLMLIYFVLCLCLFLFLFIFTKGLKSLPRSTSSITAWLWAPDYRHKNAGLESSFVR